MRRRTAITGGVALLALVLLAVGLVQSGGGSGQPPGPSGAAPAGPARTAALADLRRRGNALEDATPADLRAQLRRLRGTPVVINVWGSWCEPCREEFPVLRRVAARTQDRVGWLGIDVLESGGREPAERFLARERTTWPHLYDPSQRLLRELGTGTGNVPLTAFVDRRGRVVSVKYGPYRSDAELLADVRRRTGADVGGAA